MATAECDYHRFRAKPIGGLKTVQRIFAEWQRFFASLGYAWTGIRFLLTHEPNIRIHLSLALAAILLAALLHLSPIHWGILILTIGFVLVTEAINTAIEALTDLVSPEYHPQAKIVKDVAAGAVLLAAIIAIGVGLIIFLPALIDLVAN